MHASHFYSFLILYIGKSVDPIGTKPGEEDGKKVDATVIATVIVDDDLVQRYIVMCEHWTGQCATREEAIAAISPFVVSKREETFLDLLSMLLESVPDEAKNVNNFMHNWDGNYHEMFLELRIHIREVERVRNEEEEATATATTTTTTTTTTIDLPDNMSDSNDNLSVDNALFEEDVHTIPQDIVVDAEEQAATTVVDNLEEDHEHAHQMKLHVQNRKEADHEKEISVRGKAGSNKLARRTTRSNSNRNILEDN
jgi:hypothetical protein